MTDVRATVPDEKGLGLGAKQIVLAVPTGQTDIRQTAKGPGSRVLGDTQVVRQTTDRGMHRQNAIHNAGGGEELLQDEPRCRV
jgi:hypothetical protein